MPEITGQSSNFKPSAVRQGLTMTAPGKSLGTTQGEVTYEAPPNLDRHVADVGHGRCARYGGCSHPRLLRRQQWDAPRLGVREEQFQRSPGGESFQWPDLELVGPGTCAGNDVLPARQGTDLHRQFGQPPPLHLRRGPGK